MTDPLIRQYAHSDQSTLQDCWLVTASEIEQSLIEAGATPGEDYGYLDLYKLAMPVVVERVKNDQITPPRTES